MKKNILKAVKANCERDESLERLEPFFAAARNSNASSRRATKVKESQYVVGESQIQKTSLTKHSTCSPLGISEIVLKSDGPFDTPNGSSRFQGYGKRDLDFLPHEFERKRDGTKVKDVKPWKRRSKMSQLSTAFVFRSSTLR